MGIEIERKFLVNPENLDQLIQQAESPVDIRQGYIETLGLTAVRVRVSAEQAYLTIKGANNQQGLTRSEYEYPIPATDARSILSELCGPGVIEKLRYRLLQGEKIQHVWEIDVFGGANAGLIVAEVELAGEDEEIELPPWVLREVTGDNAYYNSVLAVQPFTTW